jgi:hypothetical protein
MQRAKSRNLISDQATGLEGSQATWERRIDMVIFYICILSFFFLVFICFSKQKTLRQLGFGSICLFLLLLPRERKFLVDDWELFSFIAWRIGEFVTVDKGACFVFFAGGYYMHIRHSSILRVEKLFVVDF